VLILARVERNMEENIMNTMNMVVGSFILFAVIIFISSFSFCAMLFAAINFDSLLDWFKERKKPRGKPITIIQLSWYEIDKYIEFLSRHGYNPKDRAFAKDVLFKAMHNFKQTMINREE
jgi:hypothetical protein